MLIYSAEAEIEEQLRSNTTISYISTLQKLDDVEIKLFRPSIDQFITKSSVKDEELFFYKSILVSTTLNKNDDYFLKEIVWAAKDTPTDKPVNINHDSTKVIGHTISSFAIDPDGNLIDSNTKADNLPDKFHLLVGSVIYRIWHSDEEYEKSIAETIEKIEAGELYVSQECRFKNFDYLLSNEKETKIVTRNKETAFLTKYMRAYGGDGKFQDYSVARVVKDISFVGKGIVEKPANPESVIILPKNDIFDFADAKVSISFQKSDNFGVVSESTINLAENNTMDNFYKDQVDELKVTNQGLSKSLEDLKEKLTQSNVSKLEKEIESLTSQVKDMGEVITKKNDEVSVKENSLAEVTKKYEDLVKANDELVKLNKELSDKVAATEAESKATARHSTLVAGGLSKEDADAKVKAFAALTDEQFQLVATEIVEARKNTKVNTENPTGATAGDVENAETTDAEVTAAGLQDSGLDVGDLAKKLSAELKTNDGDK